MSTVEAARRELVKHIGYREKGTNDTIFNREYGKLPGYPAGGYGYPWCHSFVSVCLKRAGLRPGEDFPWTVSCVDGVAWFKKRGRWGKTPRAGALVYYGPQGGTHVEWVEQVTATEIVTIGGNTSGSLEGRYFNGDGVYRKRIPRSSSRIYGFGYTMYHEEDDMPLTDADAKKVAKAVMASLTHKVTDAHWAGQQGIFTIGQQLDPKAGLRQTWAYGKDTNARVRKLEKTIAAQGATITTLAAALGQGDELLVDELVERIGARVEAALAAHDVELQDDVDEPDPENESDVDDTPAPVEPAEG
ncbi:CHAP domain-containing protein [Microbispora sp. SCL1-1]|uniref:CHAP domain-containing protein n=1 Tax=unclassified Microbispora TaxID=2614687 RepID=UPI001159D6B2|nr:MULTISPECIES: CHAP domain-containing protein [unclassified Microbispora]NJP27121.1 CHAP domain-containing protein [Microbispora sp. CL1-1]TQS11466.1 CHAP domain-containing protein [Microbispora sp. SCL1-1]